MGIRVTSKYKVRATLVLCCLANGDKFPPMLIFKESSGTIPKKIKDMYDKKKIVIKGNHQGWMNAQLLQEWVDEVWKPNIIDEKGYLMIWDSFASHKDPKISEYLLEECDTQVVQIPGGCTSVLQPLDIGINKPLKDKMRKRFQSWVVPKLLNPTSIIS